MEPIPLTKEIIDELKQQYPTLYRIRLGNQDFVFRPLTRQMWMQIQEFVSRNPNIAPNDIDDKVVEYGLVWPKLTVADFLNLPAGYSTQLSRYIQARSGFYVPGINEDLPESEPIVETRPTWDPPTPEQIEALKSKYPAGLLLVRIGQMHFVVRPLLRSEWRAIGKQVDSGDLDVDSAVFERAVVFPDQEELKKLETMPGLINIVSNEIVRFSGFTDEEQIEVEEL